MVDRRTDTIYFIHTALTACILCKEHMIIPCRMTFPYRVKKNQIFAQFILLIYFVNLYMFQAYLGPSPGGTTVFIQQLVLTVLFNPLNPELNPICYLLALLGAHHFLHVSRIRVKLLTFRLLMSYIYIYIWSTHS